MKKIAVFAPNHLSSSPLIRKRLSALITVENIVFLCIEGSAAHEFVQEYSNQKNIEIQLFQQDCSQHVNLVDDYRDNKMIAQADELVIFYDGVNEKIGHLMRFAIQIGITIHTLKIQPLKEDPSIIYEDYYKHFSLEELQTELKEITAYKAQLIKEMRYDEALQIHNKIRVINEKMKSMKNSRQQ
jgi:hypothetical protein